MVITLSFRTYSDARAFEMAARALGLEPRPAARAPAGAEVHLGCPFSDGVQAVIRDALAACEAPR